jgi:hypothetical protein
MIEEGMPAEVSGSSDGSLGYLDSIHERREVQAAS